MTASITRFPRDDGAELPPLSSYDDEPPIEMSESGEKPRLNIGEAVAALELTRRLDVWAPPAADAVLALPDMPPPIVRNLVLPGTVAIAPGEGGAGKTTLYVNMNMAIATGTEFLGFNCDRPGSSVHLLAEDDQQRAHYTLARLLMAEREQMKAEGWSAPAIDQYTNDVRERVRLISVRGVGATLAVSEFGAARVAATVDALCTTLAKVKDLRTVVFDTLSRFAGVPLDSNDSAPIVLTALERIAERTGAFVLATHHTGKAAAREKNEDQYSARGASAITDNARLVLRLRPLDPEEVTEAGLLPGDGRSYLRLSVPKSNYFPRPDPIVICRIGFLFRLATSQGQDIGALYRRQLRELSAAMDELGKQQLKASKKTLEHVPSLGGRNQARRIIETCLAQNWIGRKGTGPATEIVLTEQGRNVLRATGDVAATCGEVSP